VFTWIDGVELACDGSIEEHERSGELKMTPIAQNSSFDRTLRAGTGQCLVFGDLLLEGSILAVLRSVDHKRLNSTQAGTSSNASEVRRSVDANSAAQVQGLILIIPQKDR
jgi:hypothetical protein